MMKINLKGKNALVGGSTKGLGKAIAIQLAKCGANVTIMSRNSSKFKSTLQELNTDYNQTHQFLEVDFNEFDAFKAKIDFYFEHNAIDILVNNTNGPVGGTVMEKSTNDYQEAFNLLFKTVQYTTMKAVEAMKENQYGRIINATSISVKEPLDHLVLSNTIRAAVIAWAKTLSRSLASNQITVNNILTGIFDTERITELNELQAKNKGISIERILDELTSSIPMKRLGNAEEFGYLVAFLASSYASYITGTNIAIDGGFLKSV